MLEHQRDPSLRYVWPRTDENILVCFTLHSSETLITNLLLFTTKLEIQASLIYFFFIYYLFIFLIQRQYSIGIHMLPHFIHMNN